MYFHTIAKILETIPQIGMQLVRIAVNMHPDFFFEVLLTDVIHSIREEPFYKVKVVGFCVNNDMFLC